MSDSYVPGTEETDPKKQNMAIQQLAATTEDNSADIATNTAAIVANAAAIAANTAAIAAIGTANKGYFAVDRNGTAGSGSAGTINKIQFNHEVVDSQNWFDAVTNFRYQPTEAGKYFFGVGAKIAANSGGASETGEAVILLNGSSRIFGPYLNGSFQLYSTAVGMILLNGSTDYVEGAVYLPTGVTSYSGGVNDLYMFGWKVGA